MKLSNGCLFQCILKTFKLYNQPEIKLNLPPKLLLFRYIYFFLNKNNCLKINNHRYDLCAKFKDTLE